MVRFWNKDLRKITFMMILIVLMGGALCNLALYQFAKKETSREYDSLAGIVESVKQAYPDAREEEVIRAITGKASSGNGKELLARYGILEKAPALSGKEEIQGKLYLTMNLIWFTAAAMAACVFLWFWKRRNAKISELCHYVDRISLGEDNLDIRGNQEDELSGIKNELYKLMISMREQAGAEKQGKAALAKAVENISHQLKTPLTSVVVLADNMLEDEEMDPKVRKRFVQEISRQLIGMKWLVVTMLKLSRFDAGVVELAKEPVSIKKSIEEAILNLEMNAEWKEIHFETKYLDASIAGDEKWLTEGFQNIIKNALEYSPQGGIIEIEMEDNDVYAQVSVRDYGPGIPEEARKHLFERFYSTSKVENENVGIGLALSKEIIEKHNGYVTVDSDEGGTKFIIKFMKHF